MSADPIERPTRPLTPEHGYGICPTVRQNRDTWTNSYNIWANLLSNAKESAADVDIAEHLLELLRHVPKLDESPTNPLCLGVGDNGDL